MICGSAGQAQVLVGLYRTTDDGPFSDRELQRIEQLSAVLAGLACKHASLTAERTALRPERATVARELGRRCPTLSLREREVCACLLLGMAAKEIGAALDVRVSSVVTFRKRAFLKLGISSVQMLALLYQDGMVLGRNYADGPQL